MDLWYHERNTQLSLYRTYGSYVLLQLPLSLASVFLQPTAYRIWLFGGRQPESTASTGILGWHGTTIWSTIYEWQALASYDHQKADAIAARRMVFWEGSQTGATSFTTTQSRSWLSSSRPRVTASLSFTALIIPPASKFPTSTVSLVSHSVCFFCLMVHFSFNHSMAVGMGTSCGKEGVWRMRDGYIVRRWNT